jgi:hypothetical protein
MQSINKQVSAVHPHIHTYRTSKALVACTHAYSHACRPPCKVRHRPYMPRIHCPLSTIVACEKDTKSKLMAQPMSQLIKRHAGLLSRSSTLSSPLACLLSLHFPRVYRIQPCARARLDRRRITRRAAHEHPIALSTLPVIFSLLSSLPVLVPSHSRALQELSHDVQQA